jgi:hypothetical protein
MKGREGLLANEETEDEYRQLSAECMATAERITDPDMRASYLRLAMSYARLAQFHERIKSSQAMAQGTEGPCAGS